MTKENTYNRHKIKEIPKSERPLERLYHHGAEAMSNSELLAIVIRCGTKGKNAVETAISLIESLGSLKNIALSQMEELCSIKGIGKVRAAQIIASIELGRRIATSAYVSRQYIKDPEDAAGFVMPLMRHLDKEEFRAILLDSKLKVIKTVTISIGSIEMSVVHPREVFKEAIKHASSKIIVAHNHPSGDPLPSSEDIAVTKRLMEAGALLGIDVLDHLIIGDNSYCSINRYLADDSK